MYNRHIDTYDHILLLLLLLLFNATEINFRDYIVLLHKVTDVCGVCVCCCDIIAEQFNFMCFSI
jgi:hypothetical protein